MVEKNIIEKEIFENYFENKYYENLTSQELNKEFSSLLYEFSKAFKKTNPSEIETLKEYLATIFEFYISNLVDQEIDKAIQSQFLKSFN